VQVGARIINIKIIHIMKLNAILKGAFARFSKKGKKSRSKSSPTSSTNLKKEWESDYVIETGTKIDGVQYYYHKDIMATPCQRYLYLSNFLQEYDMRFDREYLLQEIEAREKLELGIANQFTVKNNSLNLLKAANDLEKLRKLTMQSKERLELVFEPDLIYKIASVVLFDKKENPGFYDAKYGTEKIKKWKEAKATDFFLTMPLNQLLRLNELSQTDLETYLKVASEVKKEHLESISTILSSKAMMPDLLPLSQSET